MVASVVVILPVIVAEVAVNAPAEVTENTPLLIFRLPPVIVADVAVNAPAEVTLNALLPIFSSPPVILTLFVVIFPALIVVVAVGFVAAFLLVIVPPELISNVQLLSAFLIAEAMIVPVMVAPFAYRFPEESTPKLLPIDNTRFFHAVPLIVVVVVAPASSM
jgi:hypothetical protein